MRKKLAMMPLVILGLTFSAAQDGFADHRGYADHYYTKYPAYYGPREDHYRYRDERRYRDHEWHRENRRQEYRHRDYHRADH
ncbi:hypothetical protein LDB30_13645 [Acidithiobacillus ferrooxidans]|nr:hypothetical protein LDB30_13645 [Acidithiobacillus ferrooxidans]